MKKIKYILPLLFCLLFSCEDFLDKQPLDQLSNATFWKTTKDANMALTGVYSTLKFERLCDRLGVWDAITDNAWGQFSEGNIPLFWNGSYNATTGTFSADLYNKCYSGIAKCNIFLANIDNVDADQTVLAQYKAEVRFIRAFYYYWLTESFGGVVLTTTPLGVDDMKIPRSSKADVVKQIYEDLDYAIANLPNVAYTGHAIKSAALALKARVKLFNGEFADAATLAKSVIENGLFKLSTNYASIFVEEGDQEHNPEIIFSIKYLAPSYNLSDLYMGWYGSADPLKEFVDCHESGDTRLKANVLQWGDYWPARSGVFGPNFDQGARFYGYIVKKWVNQTLTNDNTKRSNDVPHIRYAEVLLVYAEAKNESSGPDQSIYDAVNLVRNRAGLGNLPSGLSQAEMREKIRHERRVELCFEGQRFFDMKRWKIASDIIPTIPNPITQSKVFRVWKDAYYLFPIPQSEIDKNPDLVQNPGY